MKELLKLAEGLSVYNDGRYDGYVIGKAQWFIDGVVETVQSHVKKEKKGYLMVEVTGYDVKRCIQGKLFVTMIRPSLEKSTEGTGISAREPKRLYRQSPAKKQVEQEKDGYCFCQSQVEAYLKKVRDTNPIHRGEKAIVPGLMLLDFLLEYGKIADKKQSGKIRFVSPLPVENRFWIQTADQRLEVMSEKGMICYI